MDKKKSDHKYYMKNKNIIVKKQKIYNKTENGKKSITKTWKKRHTEAKNILKELKINGCSICGYDKTPNSLHFHHVVKYNKKHYLNVTQIRRNNSKFILIELNRCLLVCCNCHGEIHDK